MTDADVTEPASQHSDAEAPVPYRSGFVAVVGRPNVGKSTLFNRLTKSRTAIVDETAGTTRDRQYGKVDWNGKEFSIVDTGGWVVNSDDVFESEINKQVELAIEQADEILFVVDAMNGVTDLDDHVRDTAQVAQACHPRRQQGRLQRMAL